MLERKSFYLLSLIFFSILFFGCIHSHKNNIIHKTSKYHNKTIEESKFEMDELSNKIISFAETQKNEYELPILKPITKSEFEEEARRRDEIKKFCVSNKDSHVVLERLVENDDFNIRSEAYIHLLQLNKDDTAKFNDILKKIVRDKDYRVRGRILFWLLSEKYDITSLPYDLIADDESDESIKNIYSNVLDDARMITQMDIYKKGRQDLSLSPSAMQEIFIEQIFLKRPEYIENAKNILFDPNENRSLKNILIDIMDRMPYSEKIKHTIYLPILFNKNAGTELKLSVANKFDKSDTDIMMPVLEHYINEDSNGAAFAVLSNFTDKREFKDYLMERLKSIEAKNEKIDELLYKCNLKGYEEEVVDILKSEVYGPETKETVFKLIWINNMRDLLPLVETFISNENERIRKAARLCKYELLN